VISVVAALDEIVAPAVRAVFVDGEVSAIAVKFDPTVADGSITVLLTAEGEDFYDLVVQGNVDEQSTEAWRERLRSDMADFVSESRFGWGQNRGV
jgi:hypothetical protein